MSWRALLALLLVLGACAAPPIAVPEAERLSESEREDYRTAIAAWVAGDAERARDAVTGLRALEPWYVPAHVVAQDAMSLLGQRESARALYRAEAESRPDDAARVLLAGRLSVRDGGAREAAYRRALELAPESPWPALALSFELNRLAFGTYAESVRLADEGFADRASAKRELAERLHDEARDLAASLVERFPSLADVHAGAAEVLLTRGEALGERDTLVRAQQLAETAVELDPAHPARYALVARIKRALIDDPGAEAALRQALELDEDDPDLMASLGRVLLDLGRPEEALEVLATARDARPLDPVIATDLGVAAQRSGDLDAAVRSLDRAAQLDESDARPVRALALVHIERGDRAAARRSLREYVARGGAERDWAEETLAELRDPVQ